MIPRIHACCSTLGETLSMDAERGRTGAAGGVASCCSPRARSRRRPWRRRPSVMSPGCAEQQRIARAHYDALDRAHRGTSGDADDGAHPAQRPGGVMLLANEHPSLEEGQRILALAEELGTTEDILDARINLGLGQRLRGDPQAAIRDLELALDQCLAGELAPRHARLPQPRVGRRHGRRPRPSTGLHRRRSRAGTAFRKPSRVLAPGRVRD